MIPEITPHELQLLRRLHHTLAWKAAGELVRVEAGHLATLIDLVWREARRADIAELRLPENQTPERQAAAERRLCELIDLRRAEGSSPANDLASEKRAGLPRSPRSAEAPHP